MVPTARDNQRPFWPLLLLPQPIVILPNYPLRPDDSYAADRRSVSTEYMDATTGGQVPDSDRTVSRTADQLALVGSQTPNTAAMTDKGVYEKASGKRVYVNGMIV